ncbi:MAG: P-II family nitrogen regulator [Candidatus Omnitrophota bacterium]|nr:P-II family nitrogen regulator [Candidatus Omnitrophota bacterium]
MKKIEAIIRSEKVGQIRQALEKTNCTGLTLIQVGGQGCQKGMVQKWKNYEYKVGILPKTKIEIVVDDDSVKTIVAVICEAAKTGECGDGKIFIYPVEEAIRVRTGETGLAVLSSDK